MMVDLVALISVAVSVIVGVIRGDTRWYWASVAITGGMAVAWWALTGVWQGIEVSGTQVLVALFMLWWRRRKDRKRAMEALSRKYRHVRDAMMRTLRERRQSRPALAPGRA